jgi:hypothetical protein
MADYLSAEQAIENAPSDLEERDVEDVFGGKVRVRARSAHAATQVVQGNVKMVRGQPDVQIAAVQIAKFERGVIAPKFTHDQVVRLHRTSGPSFTKVVAAIDEISGMTEDAEEEAEATFPDGPAAGDDQ